MRAFSFILLGCLACTVGCAHPLQRFEYNAIVMAADARVVLYARDESIARNAAEEAISRMHELEAIMSSFQPNSELSRLVASEPGVTHRISDELYRVLDAAQQIAHHSDGAFDITIGPLTQLWRRARDTGATPDESTLAEAAQLVGWRMLTLDGSNRTAKLETEGMMLDLGGIGKGFAVDEAMALLRERGITRCLIGLSGDMAVGCPPPGQRGWSIAVSADGTREAITVTLTNAAISTSGDHYQHIVIDGVRRSHIHDPTEPSLGLHDQTAVTVIAPTATIADGLATALSVIGIDDSPRTAKLLRHYPAVHLIQHGQQTKLEKADCNDDRLCDTTD